MSDVTELPPQGKNPTDTANKSIKDALTKAQATALKVQTDKAISALKAFHAEHLQLQEMLAQQGKEQSQTGAMLDTLFRV